MKTNRKWNENCYLVTIDDPLFLPCKSIQNLFEYLLEIVDFKFTILSDILGYSTTPCGIYNLQQKQGKILLLSSLIKDLNEIRSFDWGDFFLFLNEPKDWDNPYDWDYPYLIHQTDTTVRAVDDQYMYIYTPYSNIIEHLKKKYTIESVSVGTLGNLQHPF